MIGGDFGSTRLTDSPEPRVAVAQLPHKAGREQAGGCPRAGVIRLSLTPVKTLSVAWRIW